MRYLGLVLFLPAFALLTWLYLAFPRARPRTPTIRRYDAGALLLATAVTTLAVYLASSPQPEEVVGPIWPQVLASLAAYHVFPLLLLAAWWLRRRIHR